MHEGFIKTLNVDRNFCFIAVAGGPDVYASPRVFADELEWNSSLQGRRVRLHYNEGDRGRYATAVVPATD